MSVLIKGMEMPTNCNSCPLIYWYGEHVGCGAIRKYISYDFDKKLDEERHEFCPLVPVPPHGRLIDADAIYEKITDSFGGIDCAKLLDEDFAPTVIPADVPDTNVGNIKEGE